MEKESIEGKEVFGGSGAASDKLMLQSGRKVCFIKAQFSDVIIPEALAIRAKGRQTIGIQFLFVFWPLWASNQKLYKAGCLGDIPQAPASI